jgi:hypothetical protein
VDRVVAVVTAAAAVAAVILVVVLTMVQDHKYTKEVFLEQEIYKKELIKLTYQVEENLHVAV